MDWRSWSSGQKSMQDYRKHVSATLSAQGERDWLKQKARRSSSTYDARDFLAAPSMSMEILKTHGLAWDDQLLVRGWCRLRAGVTCLRHVDGRASQAISQNCIFCGCAGIRNPLKHVIGKCSEWADRRNVLVANTPWENLPPDLVTAQFFQRTPGDRHFLAVLRMAAAIDRQAEASWT